MSLSYRHTVPRSYFENIATCFSHSFFCRSLEHCKFSRVFHRSEGRRKSEKKAWKNEKLSEKKLQKEREREEKKETKENEMKNE